MKHLVTITPPTPNGDLHLGHLSGPFLAADVRARTLRQQGHDVLLLSYSDDYQSYVLRQARKLQQDRREIVLRNAAAMLSSLRQADIHLSHFLQALDNEYFAAETGRYVQMLVERGQLQTRETWIPYCRSCEVHGYEGFGRGTCNFCDSPSDASQCEVCARTPDVLRMGEIKCVLCNEIMSARANVTRAFWKIGAQYAAVGVRHLSSTRAALRDYLAEVLAADDDEWPLTRPGESSIPTGMPQVAQVHTWFAGLAGYRATLREYLDATGRGAELDDWWSPQTTMSHFLGFDCAYSHAVAYAALLSLERSGPQNVHYLTNRFLKLEGEDFSTSRNHAIWIRDVVDRYPVDAIRLFTAAHAPEQESTNFSRQTLERWVAEEYGSRIAHGTWRNLGTQGAPPAADSAVSNEIRSLLTHWRRATGDEFSIVRLAALQQQLLALTQATAAGAQSYGWLLFSHCGQALHPSLSNDIDAAVVARNPAARQWLRSVMHA